MNDIQTEMIMNSDSSNVVNEILNELQDTPSMEMPMQMQMQMPTQPQQQQQQMQQVNPNNMVNEGAVINQYDNKDISNEAQFNRQLDPYMNINPELKLDLKNKDNMENMYVKRGNNFLVKPLVLKTIYLIKNISILFVILIIFLSPLITKLFVKLMPKLYGSSVTQIFKWLGLIIKAFFISTIFNVLTLFV